MDPDASLPPVMCRSLLPYEVIVAEITNPRRRTIVTQVITEGADCCEMVFEQKP